jgi:PTS system N-acetylgalactosamine-specific IIA component
MSERPAAIVLGHATLADGLVSAVERITGRGARLHPISNEGLGGAELVARLREAMDATGATVLFTDLPAGSCSTAAVRAVHERPGAVLVMGANLPALIFFAMHDELPPADAAREAAARGGAAIKTYPDPARAR